MQPWNLHATFTAHEQKDVNQEFHNSKLTFSSGDKSFLKVGKMIFL